MSHQRISSPEIWLPPSAKYGEVDSDLLMEEGVSAYQSLANRELRHGGVADDTLIDRGIFVKNKKHREIDDADGLIQNGEVIVPLSRFGFRTSPVEAETGVPLPILSTRRSGSTDYHHASFYGEVYKQQLEHRAVRYSRLQNVSKWAHTMYHQQFDGTAYPVDEHDAFKQTILNCAGYVPPYGIHIKGKELIVRALNPKEKTALRGPFSFITESYGHGRGDQRKSIGQFIMYYALAQEIDFGKHIEVEEFLSLTPNVLEKKPELWERKFALGMKLTHEVISGSLDPVRPDFTRAVRQQALRKIKGPRITDPWPIAKSQLSAKESDYHNTLHVLLANRYGAAA